jgi:hypothetical protein
MWAILTKDRFLVGEYNKLAARKRTRQRRMQIRGRILFNLGG